MLRSELRVANLCWDGPTFRPRLDVGDPAALARLDGQFAFAVESGGRVVLARDRLGSNKLFFAAREDGVFAASYLIDVLEAGYGLDEVYSVPPGHVVTIDPARRELSCARFAELAAPEHGEGGIGAIARDIRSALDLWFGRIAASFPGREVAVCLSGGLDSSLIAALAVRHLGRVTAWSYSLIGGGGEESEDASHARRMAEHLGVPFRFVPATPEEALAATEEALVRGQDWRDFNVHCAIVNVLLARAIAAGGGSPLVLTGDLMNEIVADYTPLEYRGRTYYPLPKLDPGPLRTVLLKGLDAGDRELGVFAARGLDCLRPYALVAGQYLRIPGAFLGEEQAKQRLMAEIAGDLLPSFILGRTKVRAQMGCSSATTGILPLFVDAGRDAAWLRAVWRDQFHVTDDRALDRFLRAGAYRSAAAHPFAREVR